MLLFVFILKYQQNKMKLIRYKITIFIYIFIETITYKPQL